MENSATVFRATLVLAALCVVSVGTLTLQSADDLPSLSRHARTILFTDSSTMGLYLALAIPVDLPNKNILLGIKFEGNYVLPSNATELSQYGFLRQQSRSLRDFTRNVTYHMLRDKFDSYGFDGEQCLLKTICEAAETPLKGTGLFGDIAHIVFTVFFDECHNMCFSPSASTAEDLGPQYQLAESRGRDGASCEQLYEECPISVMAFISATEN